MSDGHGGYRKPTHPAPVSGPSKFSQRTDTGPKHMDVTGQPYGAAQDFRNQQSAAPLAPQPGQPGSTPPAPAQMPTPLSEPTQYPGQPVTSGANAGPGSSMADAGIMGPDQDAALRSQLGPLLPVFMRMADSQTATPAFREEVRQLRARLQR